MLRGSGGECWEQPEEDADQKASETLDQKGQSRHAVVRLLHLHWPSERHRRAVQWDGHRVWKIGQIYFFKFYFVNFDFWLTIEEGLAENEEVKLFVDACLV